MNNKNNFNSMASEKANSFLPPSSKGPRKNQPFIAPSKGVGEVSKQEVVSITYEEIGLFPRSFSRVWDRFFKQVFADVENLVLQEYRFYRYLFLTTVKCILILSFVPFFVNVLAKNYLVRPLTEFVWNSRQTEIFLNTYQQKRAFSELKDYEEKLYFESLILTKHETLNQPSFSNSFSPQSPLGAYKGEEKGSDNTTCPNTRFSVVESSNTQNLLLSENLFKQENFKIINQGCSDATKTSQPNVVLGAEEFSLEFKTSIISRLQEKTLELAKRYNKQSIEAITNFFSDLISFFTLIYLLFALEIQINITKSFLLEVFFGLDDSKKSLLILLITDLLVGYHSSNIWELFFEFLFNHYGLPENQTGIFLLVATLPVLLDVLFKYLIFRHLNRSSPATVATYHAMIE